MNTDAPAFTPADSPALSAAPGGGDPRPFSGNSKDTREGTILDPSPGAVLSNTAPELRFTDGIVTTPAEQWVRQNAPVSQIAEQEKLVNAPVPEGLTTGPEGLTQGSPNGKGSKKLQLDSPVSGTLNGFFKKPSFNSFL